MPACSRARVTSMRHAVRCVRPNAAACTGSASPIASTLVAGATKCSACVPGSCSPIIQMSSPEGATPGRGVSARMMAALRMTR